VEDYPATHSNLCLRWDVNPALKGKNSGNQPFTVTGLKDPATMALAPRGTPLYQTTYGNVAPRIGVAYQLRAGRTDWTSVLRGGLGVFYDLGYGSLGGVSSYFPFQAVKAALRHLHRVPPAQQAYAFA
jgi:hypothetical protein